MVGFVRRLASQLVGRSWERVKLRSLVTSNLINPLMQQHASPPHRTRCFSTVVAVGAGSDLLGATGEMPTPLTPKGMGSGSDSGWGGGECIAPLSEAGRCCGVQSGSGVWARPCTCAPTTARPSVRVADRPLCVGTLATWQARGRKQCAVAVNMPRSEWI